jgi:hypothetical protein
LLAIALAGCGSDDVCSDAFIGDPSLPISLSVLAFDGLGSVEVGEGDPVPLLLPPQGGMILGAGVRATNLSAGAVQLTGWLVDEASGRIYGLEERPVVLEAAEGFATPRSPRSLSSYANIAACPSAALPRAVNDQPWTLGLRVRDCADRSAEITVRVMPVCGEPENLALCACLCAEDYVLGQPCDEGDAGPGDAGPLDAGSQR